MQVIERVAEHYDTQEVEFGRTYRWCPECVVVECKCGKRKTISSQTSSGPSPPANVARTARLGCEKRWS